MQRRAALAALAAEVAELEADEADRRELLEVATLMESMRAADLTNPTSEPQHRSGIRWM
jgi:hypothetical protein